MSEEVKKTEDAERPARAPRSGGAGNRTSGAPASRGGARSGGSAGQGAGNQSRGRGGSSEGGARGRGGKGGPRRFPDKVKPEYDQKILNIRRVTRVMAGGRRFSFSVTLIIGNRKGQVGVGIGKATDTSLAIQKAYNDAKRGLINLKTGEGFTLLHQVEAKSNSARVTLMPNKGRGLVAGSAIRSILEFAGMHDVTARVLSRSKNQLNIARATIKALEPFRTPISPKKKMELPEQIEIDSADVVVIAEE